LWLSTHLADIQAVTPDKTVRIKTLAQGHYAALDMRLMERVLDIALIAFIAISLAFPVFIWMRPHWQDMLKLEAAAQRFGDG
ncbi:hypothetical protein, partial [Escherichia coli]|uniref:hypothetical protein n=1 Tax=Escherichia coli TaxID=562 RepID=UPI0019287470